MSTIERLKALLRSLLEAFLGSKKAWASNQSFGQPSGKIAISITSGVISTYTAPVDGVISCAIANTDRTLCAVRLTTDSGEQISCQNNSGASASACVPVRKGGSVEIHPLNFSTLYFCNFYPSVGSA